jgi:uncharacterized membrane protein
MVASPVARVVWIAVALVAVVAAIGIVALWPGGRSESTDPALVSSDAVGATVTASILGPCSYGEEFECRDIQLKLTSGPNEGNAGSMELSADGSGLRPLERGDRILVSETLIGEGELSYSFFDYQRGRPMLVLALLFVGVVVIFGRWRGIGAIAGLLGSLAVLSGFMLPSLLDGNPPILVALVGSSAIAFIALYLAHGFNVATSIALLGTFASLALTGVLAWVFVVVGRFTGFTDESSFFLDALGTGIDSRGILLAGIVIGSLGVLDDVTVTQVSAVWELRRAQPEMATREVYRAAVRIGRDHISSTVNTLFLAYAGAALPLLLLFREANQSMFSIANREVVATEIVRALVGSIGLVASVPITTAMAARVLRGPAVA